MNLFIFAVKMVYFNNYAVVFLQLCLKMDPAERPLCSQLLKHDFFKKDNFCEKFAQELKAKITRETADNPLLRSINGRHDSKDESAEEKARRKKRKEKEKVIRTQIHVCEYYSSHTVCDLV